VFRPERHNASACLRPEDPSLSATSHCSQLNTQVSVADWSYRLVAWHISRKALREEYNRLALTPDLVIALGPSPALALKSATATVPIVFVVVADPVGLGLGLGLIQSLSRPGGNITGLASWVPGDWTAKQIQIPPGTGSWRAKIALLVNPGNPMHRLMVAEEAPSAARKLGVALPIVEATTDEELDIAFASAAVQHADAMIVLGDVLINRQAPRVIALAGKHPLPAMHFFRQFADGRLVVYGPIFRSIASCWQLRR
jgi:putative ABC transport system substrate-binding protein